jgi:hypothetical protein
MPRQKTKLKMVGATIRPYAAVLRYKDNCYIMPRIDVQTIFEDGNSFTDAQFPEDSLPFLFCRLVINGCRSFFIIYIFIIILMWVR